MYFKTIHKVVSENFPSQKLYCEGTKQQKRTSEITLQDSHNFPINFLNTSYSLFEPSRFLTFVLKVPYHFLLWLKYLNHHVASILYICFFKISIFHWNPFCKKTLRHWLGIAMQYSFLLQFRRNI